MQYIDSHAHIYLKDFKEDRIAILERSREAGIIGIYMPNIDQTSIDDMLELEEQYPDYCFPMMGLHPCSVNKNFEKELYLIEGWLNRRKFVAIGEMGIDLYWDTSFQAQQEEAFSIQADWAKALKKPLVIHCREAFEEAITLVEQAKDENLKGVFHCFTGTEDDAKRVIELGFYLGIGGVSTFKNSGLDQVLPHVNLEHILLETDSPYLAPVPYRGKRNEPAYVSLVAQRVAELTGEPLEKVAEITTQNAKKLFEIT